MLKNNAEKEVKVKYCDWCNKPIILSEDVYHFDREGFCSIKWNLQAHYGDYVNKQAKENPDPNDAYKYTIPNWGG